MWLKILTILLAFPFLLLIIPTISVLYRLFFRIPIVEINELGISYNPPFVWFIRLDMSIRWEEIAALYVNELTMQRQNHTRVFRLLAVVPNERESFPQREKIQSIRRFPMWGFLAATKTPFMLPEGVIAPTSLEHVLALIKNTYRDKLQENSIEIRDEQKNILSPGRGSN